MGFEKKSDNLIVNYLIFSCDVIFNQSLIFVINKKAPRSNKLIILGQWKILTIREKVYKWFIIVILPLPCVTTKTLVPPDNDQIRFQSI